MNRLQKILLSIAAIFAIVIAISLVASSLIKPNQQTPIKKVLPAQASTVKFPEGFSIAAWVWHYPTELTDKISPMIEFASNEGINTFYVYIDEYIDIYEMPNSPAKDEKMANYTKALKNIISQAKAKNIKVHALSGNNTYGYDSHSYIPPIILSHVFNFNKENPDTQFDGIQFDIEFYDDPRFFGSTEEYTQFYLKLVDELAMQTVNLNKEYNQKVRLGFVIPFWFDKANDYFAKPILPQIVKSLSRLQDSYLVVMAYRNVIDGTGSVMEISKDELSETVNTPIKIIIAQELTENKDQKITHFGKSRDEIKTDLEKIITSAKTYPSFEGLSIHDLDVFMETR